LVSPHIVQDFCTSLVFWSGIGYLLIVGGHTGMTGFFVSSIRLGVQLCIPVYQK
jgi:hypothetical protein